MHTAVYLRKSRAEEIQDSTQETLLKHRQQLFDFAKKQSLDVAEVYEEVKTGEYLSERPEMLRLLRDVEQNKYEAVLCMDIDRLGRGGMVDQGLIFEAFKSTDTKIVTPRKIYDLNNELDEEYTEFEAFMARKELKLIKRRLAQGKQQSLKNGCYMSNAPFGYASHYEGKNPTLKIVPEEADFVRSVFDWYVNEGLGCQIIADRLNNMGAKPRRSDKFCRTSVMKILRNNVYIGKIVWNQKKHYKKNNKWCREANDISKWIITDGLHPAIIDEELFNKAQEIIKQKTHPPSNVGIIKNPLSGLVKCSVCGFAMQRRPYKTKPTQFMCPNKGCQKSSNFEVVENALMKEMRNTILRIEADEKQTENNERAELIIQNIKKTDAEINTAKKQINKLYDLLEQSVYTIELFTERNNSLREKIQALENEKKQLEETLNRTANKNTKLLKEKIEHILKVYHTSTTKEKNDLLKEIIKRIDYTKPKEWHKGQLQLEIEYKDL